MSNLSLEAAEAIHALANIALIVGAILAATGTLAVFWTNGVINRYKDERIAQNERIAAEATLEAERIKQQLAWRRLSPEQSALLSDQLRGLAPVLTIETINADPEAVQFALDIAEAVKNAGINVKILRNAYVGGGPAAGATIVASEPHLSRIFKAFSAAQLDVHTKEKPGVIEIIVGPRPAPAL